MPTSEFDADHLNWELLDLPPAQRFASVAAMLEIVLMIAVCVLMAKVANNSDENGAKWGGISAGICVVCLFLIPIPFARVLLAAIIAFVALTVKKMRE